jgi:O-antigen/teichoic acid export membrane protein
MMVGGLLFIGIWANRHNIFNLMPEDFRAGNYVLLFIGLARLIDIAVGINAILLVTSPKYRYDLIFNVILVGLIIVTNYLFIPRFGISGAAFASLLAYVLSNLLRLGFVWRAFGLQPFTSRSLLVLGIGGFTLAVGTFIPYFGTTVLDIIGRSAIITVVYGVLILLLRVSEDADQAYQYLFRLFFRKRK